MVQDLSMDSPRKKAKNERFAETDDENEGINEVNYTYNMDPTALSLGGWENGISDHEVEAALTAAQSSSDFDEEDEYDNESIANRENQAKLAMMFKHSNLMHLMKQNRLSGLGQFLVCEKCPEKQYFDEEKLQLHVKREHGVNKMNVCNICGKTYAWKSGLYKHKRHVHNISGKKLTPVNENVMVLGGGGGSSDNQSMDSSTEATSPPMTPTELVSPPSMMSSLLFANEGTAEVAAAAAPAEAPSEVVAPASFSPSPPSMDVPADSSPLSSPPSAPQDGMNNLVVEQPLPAAVEA